MLQSEFTERTKVQVSDEEFEAINEVYMHCDLDKDSFCALWRKMNRSRVDAAKATIKEQKRIEKLSLFEYMKEKVSKMVYSEVEFNRDRFILYDLNVYLNHLKTTLKDSKQFTLFLVVRAHGSLLTTSQADMQQYLNDYTQIIRMYKVECNSTCGNFVNIEILRRA